MLNFVRSILLGTALGLAAPAMAQTAPAKLPDTDPALWVVKDSDTTVYLFGTFHALDGKTDWFNDEVKAAFDRSSKVYFEIVKPENPAEMAPLVQKYWMATDGKPLTSKLSEKGKKDLAAALASVGGTTAMVEPMKPFAASMVLAALGMQKVGKTGEQGAEAVITAAAKSSSKPVDQLETMEFQMQLFDKLPEAEQIKMLEHTAATFGDMEQTFAKMTKAWNNGDAEGLAAMMNEMETQSPAMHQLMLTGRNATWAKWIEERMKTPGTVFVAVGAGHLAGKNSVQDYLAKSGIKTARVKY
ncbi:TraB/GumN family protein [Sphingomonas sp. LHG3443-2]|uniref:TraB/GumN family protein n=1 Tax=Sphingomonas sp. LHG3443-2 TaxID=2804639 RepID=UPI003CF68F0C